MVGFLVQPRYRGKDLNPVSTWNARLCRLPMVAGRVWKNVREQEGREVILGLVYKI